MKTGLLRSEIQMGQVVNEIEAEEKPKNITNKKYKELIELNNKTAQYKNIKKKQ